MVVCKSFNEIRNERKLLTLDKLKQYVANWGNPNAACFKSTFRERYGLCGNTNSFGMTTLEYLECVIIWSGFNNNDSKAYPIEGSVLDYDDDNNKWGFYGTTANSERRLDFAKHMINCLEVMIEDLRKEL